MQKKDQVVSDALVDAVLLCCADLVVALGTSFQAEFMDLLGLLCRNFFCTSFLYCCAQADTPGHFSETVVPLGLRSSLVAYMQALSTTLPLLCRGIETRLLDLLTKVLLDRGHFGLLGGSSPDDIAVPPADSASVPMVLCGMTRCLLCRHFLSCFNSRVFFFISP